MTDRNRIALLAGAGLCKDANFPTSVELAQELKSTLTTLCGGIDGDVVQPISRQEAARYLAAYHLLDGGIRFQRGIRDRDPAVSINIEQFALAADEVRTRFKSELGPYISGWHDRLGQLERDCPNLFGSFLEFIYSQIQHWLFLDPPRLNLLPYIRNLVEVCHEGIGVDIFTLNYDLCIETALEQFAAMDVVNGFTEEGGWQPSRFDTGEHAVRLYKLHGSLDWVEDEEYGVCSLTFPRHLRADDLEMLNLKPLLIFGTANKLSPREPFLTLAHVFAQSILHTSLLVVIGYSFGDDYVNQIIRQGVERNPRLRVLIVDPSAEEVIGGQPYLRGRRPRVTAVSRSAKEALDEGDVARVVRKVMQEVSVDSPFSEPSY